ncbi:MAG: glycosyltransferase [Planctomycetota bacterium]|nr:glycosyltransferase [Planctomycetota bacterium]MDA1214879.1 glycosyltransferase [Planctomycetota bacterium]
MHVLILPSWYPTPLQPTRGIFFREQAQALRGSGLQIGVIAPQRQSLRRFTRRKNVASAGLDFVDDNGVATYSHYGWSWFPFWPPCHAKLWLLSGRRLFEHYVRQQGMPDLIHVHSALYGGVLADELRRRYDIPYVLTEHSTAFARGIVRSWQKPMIERAFRSAAARIVVSPSLGSLLAEQFPVIDGLDTVKWEWVPNMVDPRFRPAAHDIDGTDSSVLRPFRWLNVAILTEKKGHLDLLQAFAEAFRGNRGHELRIGGDGPLREKLIAHAAALGIAEQVRFLGELDRSEVLAEMQHCDAFVLPSHVETFGVVLIEAMACGKPVIATRSGGPECIVNRTNGILVPPRSPSAFATAMRECSDDYLRFPSLTISDDCLRQFSGEAVARQLRTIYRRTLTTADTKQNVSDDVSLSLDRETISTRERAA